MIDIWQANIQIAMTFGIALIVLLLLYIAFIKDSPSRRDKRK
jgi:hypothetical protein